MFTVICQYQWGCTTRPDHNRQRYIPDERNRDALTVETVGRSLYIFNASNLDASCYGPVTAIEYGDSDRDMASGGSSTGGGQAMFNWTILILEATGNDFVINSIHFITSHLPVSSANCTNNGDQVTCCNRNNIDGIHLSTSSFAFGVTESAQGNTHGATLLGFFDALTEYRISAIVFNKNEETISIGKTIRNRPPVPRGICMLWFVIGKHS